ncbi:MAG: dihydroorotate dehydrogenase electron transfer subunit [Gammaproteobacteria bacterium]
MPNNQYETAAVLSHQKLANHYHMLRLHAPACAALARPGHFASLYYDTTHCSLSIMRTDPNAGWVDFLYRAVDSDTLLLSQQKPANHIKLTAPLGNAFITCKDKPQALLIGEGVGIPSLIFLADALRYERAIQPLFLMGFDGPLPFAPHPSRFIVHGIPPGVIAAMPLMEDWAIPSRLANTQGLPGCFDGNVVDLACIWLESLTAGQRDEAEIFASGPRLMVEAATRLALDHQVAYQASLHEQ